MNDKLENPEKYTNEMFQKDTHKNMRGENLPTQKQDYYHYLTSLLDDPNITDHPYFNDYIHHTTQ